MNVAESVLWRMAIILKVNKVNLLVSSVLFVFWYHSPNFLDTPRITCLVLLSYPLMHPLYFLVIPTYHELKAIVEIYANYYKAKYMSITALHRTLRTQLRVGQPTPLTWKIHGACRNLICCCRQHSTVTNVAILLMFPLPQVQIFQSRTLSKAIRLYNIGDNKNTSYVQNVGTNAFSTNSKICWPCIIVQWALDLRNQFAPESWS
jgi:hypothetical protein